jgi:hypothetical protein
VAPNTHRLLMIKIPFPLDHNQVSSKETLDRRMTPFLRHEFGVLSSIISADSYGLRLVHL